MRYEEWQYVPVVFTHLPHCYQAGKDVAGTMTIPWDFELGAFLAFLRRDGVKLREAREHLEQTAQRVELLVADLCRAMDLDDVLITCPHRDALPFLEGVLLPNAERLHMMGIGGGVTLEIADRFARRDNGVVVLDCAASAERVVEVAERSFRGLMPELRLRSATAKRMLADIQMHRDRFVEDTRAGGVDCETSARPYAERLAFVKELCRIGPQLAQYDWGDMTFALGPLGLDWAGRVLSLPADFDGAALVRYVEGLQQERQRAEEERGAEYEALRKHSEAMQGSIVGQYTADVAGNPKIAASSSSSNNGVEDGVDAPEGKASSKQDGSSNSDDGQQQQQQQQQAQQQQRFRHPAASWRDEYLVGSGDSAERGGPAYRSSHHRADENRELHTERPLHHDLRALENEQDAAEQLQWEGFYNDATVVQAPQREADEMATAFMHSNRKHRQEAVERMVRQLDEKYGLSTNRFRKTTLGDKLGINDPRKAAQRYPAVARGSYPGDNPRVPVADPMN
jgi:hypothetical protein